MKSARKSAAIFAANPETYEECVNFYAGIKSPVIGGKVVTMWYDLEYGYQEREETIPGGEMIDEQCSLYL